MNSDNKFLLFVVVVSICGCVDPAPTMQLRAGVKLNIYTVSPTPTETTSSVYDDVTENSLYLQNPPIVTSADVVAVELVETPEGQQNLLVSVSETASQRLYTATSQTGGRLAVMVDGVLVCAPRIQAQIRSDFQITTGNSGRVDWTELIE